MLCDRNGAAEERPVTPISGAARREHSSNFFAAAFSGLRLGGVEFGLSEADRFGEAPQF